MIYGSDLRRNSRQTRGNRQLFRNFAKQCQPDTQILSSRNEPSQEVLEDQLYSRLEQLDYDHPNQFLLEISFSSIIKDHIRFHGYCPESESIVGANLISNGAFHELWAKVLTKLSILKLEVLKPKYYMKFRYAIYENFPMFDKAFNPNFAATSETIFQQQKPAIIQEQQIVKSHPSLPLPLGLEEIDKNSIPKQVSAVVQKNLSKSVNQHPSIFLSSKLSNSKRISAEIVCMFLNIPRSRIYPIKDVKIVEVLEVYMEKKLQITIVKAQLPSPNSTFTNEEVRVCIMCYKFFRLEQLVRYERTYGEIYAFIHYDRSFNIKAHLKKIGGRNCQKL